VTYAERIAMSRRLTVLRALHAQHDGRMNDRDILDALDLYGHRMARQAVREMLEWLELAGAVRLTRPGEVVVVAEITQRGADHVERRGEPIEGVALPSRA
jgi:Fe2+ or Zn2+ uptake regulation protein